MQTLIVDFDGVIHSYISGWKGAGECSDPPVKGAIEWLNSMAGHYKLAILSSRSCQEGGIEAMREYILKHGVNQELLDNESIFFPTDKVPAIRSIDDRGYCFRGTFPSIQEIECFQPWNKMDV